MSPDEIEAVSDLVVKKLCDAKRARWVDPDTHDDHHNWVAAKMKDEEERRAMRRKVIESSIGWALPIFLAFIAVSAWQSILHSIKAFLGKP